MTDIIICKSYMTPTIWVEPTSWGLHWLQIKDLVFLSFCWKCWILYSGGCCFWVRTYKIDPKRLWLPMSCLEKKDFKHHPAWHWASTWTGIHCPVEVNVSEANGFWFLKWLESSGNSSSFHPETRNPTPFAWRRTLQATAHLDNVFQMW